MREDPFGLVQGTWSKGYMRARSGRSNVRHDGQIPRKPVAATTGHGGTDACSPARSNSLRDRFPTYSHPDGIHITETQPPAHAPAATCRSRTVVRSLHRLSRTDCTQQLAGYRLSSLLSQRVTL